MAHGSITRQAGLRLIISLGLFVLLLGVSSYKLYSLALQKSAHERAGDLALFYRARLMQLDRDWDLQANDFKVRLEVTRLLENSKESITNLQAFMTVQGTNRRFQYLLIQDRNGGKVFDFGHGINIEKISLPPDQEKGWYLSKSDGSLYRVFVVPIWLGTSGNGRMAVFYEIDNALLFSLATPGIVLSAESDGGVIASSAGQAGLETVEQAKASTASVEQKDIPWSAGAAEKTFLRIDAPINVLFSTTEMAIGAATIPVIDGLILWFTLGFWLMRSARRIKNIGGAVEEFTARRQPTATLEEKLQRARAGKADEISEVANAIEDMAEQTLERERERKEAEEALRASEKNYRSLFENMLDAYAYCRIVYEQDAARDFIYLNVNRNFEKLTGLKDVIGRKASEIIPGVRNSNPEIFEIFGKAVESGQPEKFETYVESMGAWFSIAIYGTEKDHFITVFQDVTLHKRSEQELIVLNNHLTHEVAKRTADLSALAAHIQDIAEAERTHIARELHDELGNTLLGLNREVARLQSKVSAADLLQDLSTISELLANANRTARGVINQLYPTVLDTFGFAAAIDHLVKEFSKHSGIGVELVLPEEPITIEHAFALAVYRITQECLTNIARHAGAKAVRIEIEIVDEFLWLTIDEDGQGLSGECNSDGHGVFGMMERARYLGGSIEIGSNGGTGTTARLSLPLAAPKAENKNRVLVVDDHAIVRNAIRQLLESQADDFSVEGEAADGATAIEMAIEGVWDIVLLDITLPKKNGLKVLEEIKAAKPDLPVIVLSSHAEADYGKIARAKGAACYIEKGETSKLIEAMRRATLVSAA